jgi:hypothetical protein
MADERDPQVSRRYRELGSEEPPPALDQAILAASRQSVAPRRRWYVPLAAAAVALLAVGVALHVQREQPDPETMTAPSEVKEEAPRRFRDQEAPRELRSEERRLPAPEAKRAPPMQERQAAPAAAPPIPQTAPSAAGDTLGATIDQSPERWLERIADLRRQGRHEEADKAFADFRQQYPHYRIPEDMLGKIQKK